MTDWAPDWPLREWMSAPEWIAWTGIVSMPAGVVCARSWRRRRCRAEACALWWQR